MRDGQTVDQTPGMFDNRFEPYKAGEIEIVLGKQIQTFAFWLMRSWNMSTFTYKDHGHQFKICVYSIVYRYKVIGSQERTK